MKKKINRRDFIKTAGTGCLTAAGLMLGLPTVKSAYAAKTKLSVVEWGPPWIDA
ncbi:MAG: twin-arginine translocation signal domain-containing protein, partial [Deltaproteobacteria bacterium]|nr:twin-arginine translocation signal domain-containing protein [Deltaproteobacteria bacterium]